MPDLQVVMYHYVRDVEHTRFAGLKAMGVDDFRQQVRTLSEEREMASLEACLAYLKGEYHPRRNLCVLTFDDGLKEHAQEASGLLADLGIQGLFFPITACVEDRCVAPVHMNHLLTASLGFAKYRHEFLRTLEEIGSHPLSSYRVDAAKARATYIWDTAEVAEFKYLFNFVMEAGTRDVIVRQLFVKHIGRETEIADELYLSWYDAREMQAAGMLIGGHSHRHRPLATLTAVELNEDLGSSRRLLEENLRPQLLWPFTYPYGKPESFNNVVVAELQRLGFDCAFTTESGNNTTGTETYRIRRVDCKHAGDTRIARKAVEVASQA